VVCTIGLAMPGQALHVTVSPEFGIDCRIIMIHLLNFYVVLYVLVHILLALELIHLGK
jgi:hypothetical protein